jgi:hypothetical protein
MSVSFHVFFEDPFWAGLFSISDSDTTKYCRVVFGKEPTDIELYQFVLNNFNNLVFSKIEQPVPKKELALNPKRRQKQASKEIKERTGVTQSYRTIKESLKAGKKTIKRQARRQRKENHLAFELKQQKRKEKHKGH